MEHIGELIVGLLVLAFGALSHKYFSGIEKKIAKLEKQVESIPALKGQIDLLLSFLKANTEEMGRTMGALKTLWGRQPDGFKRPSDLAMRNGEEEE